MKTCNMQTELIQKEKSLTRIHVPKESICFMIKHNAVDYILLKAEDSFCISTNQTQLHSHDPNSLQPVQLSSLPVHKEV